MKHKNNNINCNWIIKKQLAVGKAPKKQKDIEILKDNGIVSILSLCSTEEVTPPENIEKNFFCKRIVLPDHTYEEEMNIDDLRNALEVLITISSSGPVYVHCKAAVERSPLLCMAWLIKVKGLSSQQALTYLMQVNKGTCPSNKNLELLDQLSLSLRKK